MRSSNEVGERLDSLTGHLEHIERQEGGGKYSGTQEELLKEVQDFEKLLH